MKSKSVYLYLFLQITRYFAFSSCIQSAVLPVTVFFFLLVRQTGIWQIKNVILVIGGPSRPQSLMTLKNDPNFEEKMTFSLKK